LSKKRSEREKATKPAPERYSALALLGAGAVLALALLTCFNFYQFTTAFNRANRDSYRVGFQHDRLRQLDAELPREAILGYVSDLPGGEVQDSAAFLGAQYVLAPRLLVRVDNPVKPEWVLGNFSRVVDPAPYAAANHLRVVKNYGPGVVLFRRESR
jgi:hypothetical protein